MRRLNLDQLQTFLAVAETGSFSEAGRRLNFTQSAVSQQIKELEARLGTRILDRLGKKAHPTAGEELLEHARRLIQPV
jgi:DNA-binding transcriptional LysR family regulator